jgi:hypothetical protein
MSKQEKNETIKVYALRGNISFTEGEILSQVDSKVITNVTVKSYDNKETTDKEKAEGANPVTAERVYLSNEEETLDVKHNIRIVPIEVMPYKMQENKGAKIFTIENHKNMINNMLKDEESLYYISAAYAYNMISGSILGRNKTLSDTISVKIKYNSIEQEKELSVKGFFNDTPFIRNNERYTKIKDSAHPLSKILEEESFKEFVLDIKKTLSGDLPFLNIEVLLKANMTAGSEIYPSQLFKDKNDNTKEYYRTLRSGKFGFTADKINNRIRNVDVFYSSNKLDISNSIYIFGSTLGYSTDLRVDGDDAMTLIRDYLVLSEEEMLSRDLEERFFMIANIIRGGLFNQ